MLDVPSSSAPSAIPSVTQNNAAPLHAPMLSSLASAAIANATQSQPPPSYLSHKLTQEEKRWLETELLPIYWHTWEVAPYHDIKKTWVDENAIDRFMAHFGYAARVEHPHAIFLDAVYHHLLNCSGHARCGERPKPPVPANFPGGQPTAPTPAPPTPTPLPTSTPTSVLAPGMTPLLTTTSVPALIMVPGSMLVPHISPLISEINDTTSTAPDTMGDLQGALPNSGSLPRATWAQNEWCKEHVEEIRAEVCHCSSGTHGATALAAWRSTRDHMWNNLTEEERKVYEDEANKFNGGCTSMATPEDVLDNQNNIGSWVSACLGQLIGHGPNQVGDVLFHTHIVVPLPGGGNRIEGVTVAGYKSSANFKVPDNLHKQYEESYLAPLRSFKKLIPIIVPTNSGSTSESPVPSGSAMAHSNAETAPPLATIPPASSPEHQDLLAPSNSHVDNVSTPILMDNGISITQGNDQDRNRDNISDGAEVSENGPTISNTSHDAMSIDEPTNTQECISNVIITDKCSCQSTLTNIAKADGNPGMVESGEYH
uniref:Uncharacterized protein n=1 Tax=Moniliophthora roreri TaxID=221103 RepID=A0A0W0GE56_MONRR